VTHEQRWSELHGDLTPSPLVRRWLGLVLRLARPVARTGVHPDVLTGLALLVAASVLVLPPWAAALAIAASALLDALDGAVAVLQDRASRWGYLLDSLVDRLCDGLFLAALVLAGAPAGPAVACGALVMLLEYARARSGNAGGDEVGALTVGERPVRVVLPVLGLLTGLVTPALWVLTATTAVGLVHLLVVLRRQLAANV
jgi:CDP-diacylglycerol--glycerol-3-phosphate 3-phosphatidyltransferase